MTVYIENLRKSTKKLLELIKCKIKGHKGNKQKSFIFLAINNWKLNFKNEYHFKYSTHTHIHTHYSAIKRQNLVLCNNMDGL